jgi:hypothetical protein
MGLTVTRKTKELDHEKLVTVILGPLSERHWLYFYMEIVARRTRRTKATDTDLYNIFLISMESMSLIVPWNKRIIPWNKRLSLAYSRGDLS